MTEPVRRSQAEARHSAEQDTHAADVLLIADEPRRKVKRSAGRRVAVEARPSIEPLDMETVVRKLIAVLHEESEF